MVAVERWDEEAHAAEVLVAIHGGTTVPRDQGGGALATHDFDVQMEDGKVLAVEVTRFNLERELQQQAEIRRINPRFPGLRFNWQLGVIGTVDIKRLRREAPSIVVDLEARGIRSLHLDSRSAVGGDTVLAHLRSMGVRLLYTLDRADSRGGNLDIGSAPSVGSSTPDVATDVAELMARRRGKAEKLAAATADERHLFVWVETSQLSAIAAMGTGVLPTRAPALPEAIDVVWLATGYEHPRVWQYNRRVGWSDVGTPTRRPQ